MTFDESAQTDLIRDFETMKLDPAAFHHREHVMLTWAMLRQSSLDETIERLREGLLRIVTSVGAPEKYHETITVFFVRLIHHRMAAAPGASWAEFAGRNPDLVGPPKALFDRHYAPSTLASETARREFTPPDLAPM
ncbi:MAG TPA: hypothetical protein P5081_20170 [Phycisphaerae bacterium]|nr:hypothetical protein [Phycisphaerae bacterium]HRW55194.1 hypothetical protein [Phycisphaerae bacterium]